eukprot:CAMPEP_0171112574 /NCGR_PEP_ID=MMETSP0766_2-20121228/79555_1 /TAXON_ID=439317 /ORGANISM="Gambierdiscus australes, Strain CAWD 149" /LENGTH=79 /DNA_ID=CAMNT_0011574693 /DNA_START=97 /DNA_END=333 /DNA_ORIENTATION=+
MMIAFQRIWTTEWLALDNRRNNLIAGKPVDWKFLRSMERALEVASCVRFLPSPQQSVDVEVCAEVELCQAAAQQRRLKP